MELIDLITVVSTGFTFKILINETFDFVPEYINSLSNKLTGFKSLFIEKILELTGCAKCLTGQTSIIYSIIEGYSLSNSFSLLVISIFTTYIIQKIIDKWVV